MRVGDRITLWILEVPIALINAAANGANADAGAHGHAPDCFFTINPGLEEGNLKSTSGM